MQHRNPGPQVGLWIAVLACQSLPAQTVRVAIDPAQQFQTMEGFGTSFNGVDQTVPYSNANYGDAQYTQFARDYAQDLGASMFRIDLNPDALPTMPAGGLTGNLQDDIRQLNFQAFYVRAGPNAGAAFNAQKIDQFHLLGSIWTPPGWMKANNSNGALAQPDGSFNDPNNHLKFDPSNPNNIDPATLTQFSRYVAAYVSGIQQTFHVPVYALSLQNEPTFSEPYNSNSYWQHYANNASDPQFARYAQVVKAVGEEFRKDGIATKLIGPEITGPDGPISSNDAVGYFTHQQYNYLAATKADSTRDQYGKIANDYLAAYASHPFGTQFPATSRDTWTYYHNLLQPDGKPFWVTETLGESPAWYQASTDANGNLQQDGALVLAQHIHNALAYGGVSAWFYWQTADGAPNSPYNLMDNSGASLQNPERSDAPNYKYDVVKHYAHFIRPGAVRIAAGPTDASGSAVAEDPSGVNVDAYLNPSTRRLTVELINMSAAPATTDVAVPATLRVPSFQAYLTTSGDPWEQLADLTLSGTDARLTLPAESILTLDGAFRFAADLNNDGSVGFDDLIILARNYGKTGATYEMGDINGDGTIDFSDLLLLAHSYGFGSTASQLASLSPSFRAELEAAMAENSGAFSSAVPEPSVLAAFAAVGLPLLPRRRRGA